MSKKIYATFGTMINSEFYSNPLSAKKNAANSLYRKMFDPNDRNFNENLYSKLKQFVYEESEMKFSLSSNKGLVFISVKPYEVKD